MPNRRQENDGRVQEREEKIKSTKNDVTKLSKVMDAIIHKDRLSAFEAIDSNLLTYNPSSFWIVFRLRGRNLQIIIFPLLFLLILDVVWYFCLTPIMQAIDDNYNFDQQGLSEDIREQVEYLEKLINPLLFPVSFLLVYRLNRAAVRYWSARAAAGMIITACRTLISMVVAGCHDNIDTIDGFARWTCIFPVAVKRFLRPSYQNKSFLGFARIDTETTHDNDGEIGSVLYNQDIPAFNKSQYAPIYAMDKLRKLAWNVTKHDFHGTESKNALLYRQLNEKIDEMALSWGTMERISGTPLPFVYVAHLRTFLLLYLAIWHLISITLGEWITIVPLFLASWGLLGIDAAAVECERPFYWHGNHLALGRMCSVASLNIHQTLDQLKDEKEALLEELSTERDQDIIADEMLNA